MLRLRVVQAEEGDCLILECGQPTNPTRVLIDGGPETVYEEHLRGQLHEIRDAGGKLDLVVLSHVDNDHTVGLLDLMAELEELRANNAQETIAIEAFWHNAFHRTIGRDTEIEPRLKSLWANAGAAQATMTSAGIAVQGISEGDRVRQAAVVLGIPINPGFANNNLVSVDGTPGPISLGNLTLRIVGPTEENLEELRSEWLEWLDRFEDEVANEDPSVAAMADSSIPNLSSIMILAEAEGKKVLLTGDGRGDHLLQGLERAGLLSPEGTLHVDLLKVPHHGSDRNVTREFFETLTADTYVVSANGKNGNPDLLTLTWMVEAAKEQGRAIQIFVSNRTPSTLELVEERKPDEFGYRLTEMEEGADSITVEVAH
jgi:beta-lactamase superfamily II metal-dependent hydrolase